MKRVPVYPVFLPHAGCPHRCIYCSQALTGASASTPDPGKVRELLLNVLSQDSGGELAFYGGSFTLLEESEQEGWLALGGELMAQGRIAAMRISTRPDAVSAQTAARLAAAGVATVELGCQSFDPEVLRRAGREHGPQAASQALPLLQAQGIAVGIHLMPGLPGADGEEALSSLAAALALQPDFLRIHPTIVLRGTPLERLYRGGDYTPLTLAAAVQLCAKMLRQAHRARIPVIRFGLQANENLDSGDAVVAGPYHPAFGQLIRSRLWLERLTALAESGCRSIRCHPADLGDILGQRRNNYQELTARYGSFTLECSTDLPREVIDNCGLLSTLFTETD